jgi:O-acetyl-ADP-ribose deacetylase (regulator of RNase III)
MMELIKGDITELSVEAIVNAANKSLLGGGGVDGAIHKAAGPLLLEECRTLGGCETGEAKITQGYDLPAKYVIHTVGPVYGREDGKEAQLLAECYRNTLQLALENNIKTLAFPAISTGVYGYPKDEAAKIAVSTVANFIKEYPRAFTKIIYVTHSDVDYNIYKKLLKGIN